MSRTIKFRAWDIAEKKMKPLTLVTTGGTAAMTYLDGLYEPFKVMQYTGLKDKNGTPIYEGDIVRYVPWGMVAPIEQVIKWNDEYRGYRIDNPVPGYEYEAIGNIYENKELLND